MRKRSVRTVGQYWEGERLVDRFYHSDFADVRTSPIKVPLGHGKNSDSGQREFGTQLDVFDTR